MMNRLEDVNDEIQYSCKANKVDCNGSTANQGQSAEPPQEAPQEQGTEASQDRTHKTEPAAESFDLPLLETTLIEDPSVIEVEVQPMGLIYDVIYVSQHEPEPPQPEPQPYWKSYQKL